MNRLNWISRNFSSITRHYHYNLTTSNITLYSISINSAERGGLHSIKCSIKICYISPYSFFRFSFRTKSIAAQNEQQKTTTTYMGFLMHEI